MTHFDLGDIMRVTATFTDSGGNAVDPDTVTFSVLHDDDEQVDYVYGTDVEVVQQTTGVYYLDVELDDTGYWRTRVASTGAGQAAEELAVTVYSSFS